MAKYQKYAEYKDSGFEWADKLPVHWNSVHLKWISTIYAGGTPSKTIESYWENGTIPWINSGAVNQTYILEPSTYITKAAYENSSAKWIPKKALVMALAGQGNTIGMVAQLGIDTTCNQSMGAIIPNDLDYARYLFWWITSNYQNIRNMAGGDLRDGLNLEHLGDMHCPLPNKDEVQKIANFLDYETAKIDSLIAKQEKLIELLKEKRQAVISHAVTKGLNPDVKLKDSGVEWLGQVPEHWVTTKIKYVAELTPKKSEVSSNNNRLCTFVPMEKLKLGSLIKDEEKPISEVIGGYTYFKNGDLLLAKVTPCFENKNMVVASDLKNGIGFGSSEIYVLRTNYKVNTQFLYYRLQEDQFMELGTGAMTGAGGLKRVPSEFLNNFEFALPPLSEQIAITKYLNQYLIKNEYLMNKAQSAIQLMQERRTALISSAVTGKIDVRNWQHPIEAKTGLSA